MKICFVGLGSIGKRHLKNVCKLLSEREIDWEVHALRNGDNGLPADISQLITKQVSEVSQLDGCYDAIFITNPTALHLQSIQNLLQLTNCMFIEKPLFANLSSAFEMLPLRRDGIYYVAAPLRYSQVFSAMQKIVTSSRVYCARAISSSYLPDWRAGDDYRKSYSSDPLLGGGVTLDLIHEWDYIHELFGPPNLVVNFKETISELKIKSDDLSVYLAKYTDKLVEIHLDYFGRHTQRVCELYTPQATYFADFSANKITKKTNLKSVETIFALSDGYIDEMNHFLDLCLGLETQNKNSIENAYITLKIALGGIL